ncbi:MAG: DUF72 domain-containing protein [Candidatus Kaiserbacteria bacterium]|nr:DUF72 domain-containing protein [Candidatus Kaiserbacteria bacterium]
MAKKGAIYVGTSGWMYKDWGAMFYPPSLKKGHLAYLAGEFITVEINSSFYYLPLHSTFEKWREETPNDFIFAVKLSRYITHIKKLEGVTTELNRFLNRAKRLKEKLGVILIQLPPSLKYDEKLLEGFLAALKSACTKQKLTPRFALEPRHTSWMETQNTKDVRTQLTRFKNICLVFPHSAKIASFPPTDENVLSDFAYVRFHGPSEFAASRYGPRRLKPWADRIMKWHARGITTFVYFNNDIHGHAIVDARTLKSQLRITR